MDAAKRQAISACGNCGQPEDTHRFPRSTDQAELRIFAALGGPCERFAVSAAAVVYQKHLAIVDSRAPERKPGQVGQRNPMCPRCHHRHQGECVIQPGPPPGPATYSRGAALAREGLARRKEGP